MGIRKRMCLLSCQHLGKIPNGICPYISDCYHRRMNLCSNPHSGVLCCLHKVEMNILGCIILSWDQHSNHLDRQINTLCRQSLCHSNRKCQHEQDIEPHRLLLMSQQTLKDIEIYTLDLLNY